ncbi:MAG: MOMP family protein [Chlamydiales bacterium]|nr:MOMP family protein [Chlamydiales bacterium]
MIKSILSLGCASMLLASSAFAYETMEDRLDTLEKKMQEVSAKNPQETLGAAFSTSRPDTVGTHWFGTLGVIYWHPKMGGTEYAYTNTSQNIIITLSRGQFREEDTITVQRPNPPNGDVKANDFGWDLGLKAGLGYKTAHDKWDIYARYTWFESNSTSSTRKDDPSLLVALKSLAALIASHAKSSVGIDYNNIDLELARSFFTSGRFSLRPHIDVKTTWLNLSQRVTYKFFNFRDTPITGLDFKVNHSCKLWGIGPRIGVDGKLFIGNGFSFNGDLAGSILYSRFKANHKEIWPIIKQSSSQLSGGSIYSLKDSFHQFIPFVQMGLSLGWETFLNKKKQHLSLKGGYEVQYFWRANQMSNVDQSLSYTFSGPVIGRGGTSAPYQSFRATPKKYSEDVMFYGITGEARLDF